MASASQAEQAMSSESENCDEIAAIRAKYPNRCRVTCNVGQYKSVVTLQPENLDATIKFHLTPAYPSVIPDIKIRSESLSSDSIEQLEEHIKSHAKGLVGQAMLQSLMEEARAMFKANGMRPGKVRNVDTENFLESKCRAKKNNNKPKKSKSKSENEEEYEKKLPSMKTAEDVVNRIMWDDNLDADLFLVGYIDRFRGLMEKYFTAFSWEDIATVDYDVLAIPKHRIQYFKYKDVKIWDKTKRMDNVFGSANGTKTIDVVMKEVEEKEQKLMQNPEEIENGACAKTSPKHSSEDSEDNSEDDSDDEDFITVTINSSVNIGTGPKEEVKKHDKEKEYWTDKLRPNYFICVRITDQKIIDNIGDVQDCFLQREPLLAECCIPGASLHLTLSMLGLDTSEQLLHCMEALKKMKSDLQDALPKSTLKLTGVGNFYGRVAYAKVCHEKDFTDFCDLLKLNLREAGVQIRDGYEFVPHVTIAKVTRPVARARGTKNINLKYYEQFLNKNFGEQLISNIYLCSVGNARRPDGFYLTPLELNLKE